MGKRAFHSKLFSECFHGDSHVAAIDDWLNSLPGKIVGFSVNSRGTLSSTVRRYLEVYVITEEGRG